MEDLLDAQDRLNAEEFEFTRAEVEYTLSLARLNRATGTLLKQEHVVNQRIHVDCLPEITFDRVPPAAAP